MRDDVKERLWARARGAQPKPETKAERECANCGVVFQMPKTAVGERAKIGWCTGCYAQRLKHCKERKGVEYWTDHRPLGGRTGYDARPPRE